MVRKKSGRAEGSEDAIQKVKEKNMLKDIVAHREKMVNYKNKKGRKSKVFFKIFKSLLIRDE